MKRTNPRLFLRARALWFAMLAVVAAAFGASPPGSELLPDLPDAPQPLPAPVAPAEWDYFRPPVGTDAVTRGTPAIAEYTRTGGPDDSLVLTGANFSSAGAADFVAFGQGVADRSVLAPALTRRLDGDKAVLTLPSTLPANSTYFLWPRNSSGYGSPVAVNRTEAWWLLPAQRATRGRTVSLYGRNLVHGGTGRTWVFLQRPGFAGEWARVTAANPYCVQFTVPDSFANGACQVWIHNGQGGRYGWSGPLALEIAEAYAWSGRTYNVRTYGAKGDGVADDTVPVMAAYVAAIQHRDRTGQPATLYFPAGTYLLRYGIGLEHDFRLLGDGMDRTFLRCHPGFRQPRQPNEGLKLALVYGNGNPQHDIELRDLTLDANRNMDPKVNGDSVLLCAWSRSRDMALVNVRIQSLGPGIGCAFLNNLDRLEISHCEFVGGRVFLFNGRQQAVTDSTFMGANDVDTALCLWGSSEISITRCNAADYDGTSPTGQGLGRFVIGNGAYGTQANIYLGDNLTADLGPRVGAAGQNSGEQILCEGNWTQFAAMPVSATATSVTFRDLWQDYTGQVAVINRGKGLGQYRAITGFDARTHTITVAPAWRVPPDASSNVLITYAAVRWVAYHNRLDGKADYARRATAMTGIAPYGGCYDWVGDSNTFTNLAAALCCTAVEQTSPVVGIGPCYFHLYANNVIQSCTAGLDNRCGIPARAADPGIGFLGNVFRNNRASDLARIGLRETTSAVDTPGVPFDLNLYEHNTFKNLGNGFDGDFLNNGARTKNTVLYKNTFQRGTAPKAGSVGAKFGPSPPVSVGNAWTGFATARIGPPDSP